MLSVNHLKLLLLEVLQAWWALCSFLLPGCKTKQQSKQPKLCPPSPWHSEEEAHGQIMWKSCHSCSTLISGQCQAYPSCKHRLREMGNSWKTCQIEHAPLLLSVGARWSLREQCPALACLVNCSLPPFNPVMLSPSCTLTTHCTAFPPPYLKGGIFSVVLTACSSSCPCCCCLWWYVNMWF